MIALPTTPIVLYRPGAHCPTCNATAWHIGRRSAQCARCATALPLAPSPFGGERG